MSPASRFLDALAFFTCLVPARMHGGSALSECVPWIFPCGLAVGALCSAAALLAGSALAPGAFAAPLAGLAWLVCEILASRGLHWDGLADVADALGSGKRGEQFRAVLKDSRIGAMGALALLAVFAAQLFGAAAHVSEGGWVVLVCAPAWGRTLAVPLFGLARPRDPNSLGGRFAGGGAAGTLLLPAIFGACMLAAFRLSGAGLGGLALLAVLQVLLIWLTKAWTGRQGGFSGDFAGCLMELGQCLCLLCTL